MLLGWLGRLTGAGAGAGAWLLRRAGDWLGRAGRETELGREERRGSRDWERDCRARLEWVEAISRLGLPDLLRDPLNSQFYYLFILVMIRRSNVKKDKTGRHHQTA